MPFYSEDELVLLLKQKDQSAFSYFYDNYSPALYQLIYKAFKSKEQSEDCLQELFIKIWHNIAQYDQSRGRLYTWLMGITRNHIIDTLRSRNYRNTAVTAGSDKSLEMADRDNEVQHFHDGIGLWKYIERLNGGHKNVLKLFYFSGHTHQEISGILSIPLGTVKTTMRQAIGRLRLAVN